MLLKMMDLVNLQMKEMIVKEINKSYLAAQMKQHLIMMKMQHLYLRVKLYQEEVVILKYGMEIILV